MRTLEQTIRERREKRTTSTGFEPMSPAPPAPAEAAPAPSPKTKKRGSETPRRDPMTVRLARMLKILEDAAQGKETSTAQLAAARDWIRYYTWRYDARRRGNDRPAAITVVDTLSDPQTDEQRAEVEKMLADVREGRLPRGGAKA